ncbi:hypothetical protein BX666DRAFT_1916064 [Dichotomocladium elegans]|nr:hypothetical protein BX666DRAFT_1916064 [Dichotomocladium elegans]
MAYEKSDLRTDQIRSTGDQIIGSDQNLPQDFILICEFSELEGPLPLAVVAASTYVDLKGNQQSVPNDLEKLGLQTFDFNAFALRVVCVDQTAEQLDPSDELETSMKMFSIPDDTQLYTTDTENNIYAFTHHLTLFDVNARGYVHPVALSYISNDADKTLCRFETYTERFNEVARYMKKGNFSNFAYDLKCRIMDLEYTQSVLRNMPNPDISLDALQQAITTTHLMIDTVESYVAQLLHEPTSPSIKNGDDSNDYYYLSRKSSEGYGSIGPSTPNSVQDILTKEDIYLAQQDGSSHTTSTNLQPLAILAQNHEDLSKCLLGPGSDYQPRFIETLHPVAHFERKLRSLAQLCQGPHQRCNTESSVSQPSFTRTAVIPLVSAISPKMTYAAANPTLASTITHDMYAEAIRSMMDMVKALGWSSEVLDLVEEEAMFLQPSASVLMVGGSFIMNMKNPHARQDAVSEKMDGLSIIDEAEDNDDEPIVRKIFGSPMWIQDGHDQLETLKHIRDVLPHIFFALLTGRPVVVFGKKDAVQKTVEALSVFVPRSRERQQDVLYWHDDILTDTELASYKLVGTANLDPSIFKLDISCLELADRPNLITSPLYLDGLWINQIMDRLPFFSANRAYLTYLQVVMLDIALKAFIYYHMYTRDSQDTRMPFHPSEYASSPPKGTGNGDWDSSSSEGGKVRRKWSVRRIMGYLRRMEERDSGDFNWSSIFEESIDHDPPVAGLLDPESSDEEESEESSASDGMSLMERRGRKFLDERLGVHGDDQNIVIYIANLISKMP